VQPPAPGPAGDVREPSALYATGGWLLGNWQDYDRDYCVDLAQIARSMPLKADAKLFQRFSDDPEFQRFVGDTAFRLTYEPGSGPGPAPPSQIWFQFLAVQGRRRGAVPTSLCSGLVRQR
jgi:hypothetical protein